MSIDSAFMELVQLHERMWGMEQYTGRPTLAELLTSPLVVMWAGRSDKRLTPDTRLAENKRIAPSGDNRFMFSVHQNVDELNEILLGLILASRPNTSNRKLSRLYLKQKPVEITGIKLMVAEK